MAEVAERFRSLEGEEQAEVREVESAASSWHSPPAAGSFFNSEIRRRSRGFCTFLPYLPTPTSISLSSARSAPEISPDFDSEEFDLDRSDSRSIKRDLASTSRDPFRFGPSAAGSFFNSEIRLRSRDSTTFLPCLPPLNSISMSSVRSAPEISPGFDSEADLCDPWSIKRDPPSDSRDSFRFGVFLEAEERNADFLDLESELRDGGREDLGIMELEGEMFFEGELGSEFYSTEEEEEEEMGENSRFPICWDCLPTDRDRRELSEDFEWEEILPSTEEEIHRILTEFQLEEPISPESDEQDRPSQNVEWEVLLTMNNLERNSSIEPEDQDGFVHAPEYEILFGQFSENSIGGAPPAAKLAIANLPSVLPSIKNNSICAVCKEEMAMEEKVKELPCLHHYHEECIVNWLKIRNTCPVCRHELPTDDPEYEKQRSRRILESGIIDHQS